MNRDQINALAVLWVEGDQNAFSKLYDHFVDKIYRFVFFKVPNEEAFDLTENVFVKVLENREYYAVKKGSFSTFRLLFLILLLYPSSFSFYSF